MGPFNLMSVGMVTPVGLSTDATSAAIRAGVSAYRRLDGVLDPHGSPVVAARIHEPESPTSHRATSESARLTAAACLAIEEALQGSVLGTASTLHVVYVLASASPDQEDAADVDGITSWIRGRWGARCDIVARVLRDGQAGLALVLALAQREALGPSPRPETMMVVAVDSLVGTQRLGRLAQARRLKTEARPRGLVPGEAAVALVFSCFDDMADGVRAWCRIAGVGAARDSYRVGGEQPCLGEGLTDALGDALGCGVPVSPEVPIFCDLNGEPYRTHEWMLAQCRTSLRGRIVHPADCIGDTGSAALALGVALAADALVRGRTASRSALAWASSDDGLRGAVYLERY
jgi:3-oxoacyl-[acyl-carrier-protein] synthase I